MIVNVAATRDPVSELFDPGARALLARAYAAKGRWAGTRLADPGPRHLAWAARVGINVGGPDPAAGGEARSRWARGFVRSLYYQHKWWSDGDGGFRRTRRIEPRHAGALEVEVGRRVPVLGVIPAGRAVRVRIRPGGQAALRAVKRLPDSARIYSDSGAPAGRWADPNRRDW